MTTTFSNDTIRQAKIFILDGNTKNADSKNADVKTLTSIILRGDSMVDSDYPDDDSISVANDDIPHTVDSAYAELSHMRRLILADLKRKLTFKKRLKLKRLLIRIEKQQQRLLNQMDV